jgi:hypothetical protein
MSTYVSLGSRGPATGIADTTSGSINNGNWTVTFDPNSINCNVPYFEISHITVAGAIGSSFTIYIDSRKWEYVQNGYINGWDPAVPLPLNPGQYVYFYWSDSATDGDPPVVTIWMRYDQDILANQRSMFGGNQVS